MSCSARVVPVFLLLFVTLTPACSGGSGGSGSADADTNTADSSGDSAGDSDAAGDADPDSTSDTQPDGAPGDVSPDAEAGSDSSLDSDAASSGLLVGDESSPAVDAIPDLDPPPHPADGWLDLEGFPLSGVRLIAVVAPDATVGLVNDALLAVEGQLVGGSPVGEYVIIDISGDETGQAIGQAFAAFEQSDSFEAVGVDQPSASLSLAEHTRDQANYTIFEACDLVEFPGSHTDWEWDTTDGGASWGLKAARVPFAWHLRDLMVRIDDYPEIAIVDDGFWLAHDDLLWDPRTPSHVAAGYHGTGVASTIASLWSDSGGIEGVLPVDPVFLNMTVRGYPANGDEIGELRQLETILRTTDVQVLNYSKGRSFFFDFDESEAGFVLNSQILPTDRKLRVVFQEREVFFTPRSFADGMGAVFHRVINNLARKTRDDFIVTCAAGNMGTIDAAFRNRFVADDRGRVQLTTYLARDTSFCTNAAVMHSNPHLLAVEALGPPGDKLARLSNRSGNIAAPGACMGMATRPTTSGVRLGDYITSGGTSFAAPFVAGVVATLWALDPDLTVAKLREALFESALEAAGGSGPRVDAFGAVEYLDTLSDTTAIQAALVDVDDGTVDGNTRVTLGGDVDRIAHHTDGGELGDGCVDMRDFRALRDAILEGASPGTDALNGDDGHPKRDLNGDAYLHHATRPQLSDAAEAETDWSRFDFNADMRVDGRDVEAMMAVWGQCRRDDDQARLEGVNANSLAGLVSSADIWVRVPTGGPSVVSVTGGTTRSVDPDTATDLVDGRIVITARAACSDLEVCVREVGTPSSRSCQVLSDVAAGNDLEADPNVLPGAPSDRLVFHTDGVLFDDVTIPGISVTAPPAFSSRTTRLFDGYRPVLRSADGRFVAYEPQAERCLDERSGFVVGNNCVGFMNLTDGETTVMHLGAEFEPPTHTNLQAWQFSPDGSQLLVRGSPAFGDGSPLIYHFRATGGDWEQGWRWWRLAFEIDKNPSDNPAMSDDGWVYFGGADGDIHRIQPLPSLGLDHFVDDFVIDVCPETSPASEQLTSTSTTDTVAQVLPSPISVEGDVMIAARDGDDWHVDIMNAGGTERTRVIEYFEGRPTYNLLWSPTGRRIAYVSGGWTRTIELGRYGVPDEHEIITSNLGFYTGNLSWSPDGDHIMVYQPGAYTLDNYLLDTDGCGTDPRELNGFDNLGMVLIVDSVLGDVVELQCNVDGQGFPTWSADGSAFAVTQEFTDTIEEDDVTHLDVVVVTVPAGGKTRVSETMTDEINGVRNDQYDPSWGLNIIP